MLNRLMSCRRPQAHIGLALILSAAGAALPLAAQPGAAPPEAPRAVPVDEQSYLAAQGDLRNYQSCGTRARRATYQALAEELQSIESLARSKGLGPTLERVVAERNRILAISSMMVRPCVGGPVAALAGARRAMAAFRTWVDRAPNP
ncbi:MAG: hypothetical protein AB7K04_18200 [Pseudorhodoplanes sp.]